MDQKQMSVKNKIGWSQFTYEAWKRRHGTPAQFAEKLKENPERSIQYYLDEIGEVSGKRILNLLGSKGNKAVCLALLGADVTVVDISSENQRYALELAEAASVSITYLVTDVLDLNEHKLSTFDVIILEIGVLHYFLDLHPLFSRIMKMMDETSIFILRDYHPFVSKVMTFENDEITIDRDYFHEGHVEVDVAYAQLLTTEEQEQLEKNVIRRWTLSEVLNGLIEVGLHIRKVNEDKGIRWAFPEEAPRGVENRVPGTFAVISTM